LTRVLNSRTEIERERESIPTLPSSQYNIIIIYISVPINTVGKFFLAKITTKRMSWDKWIHGGSSMYPQLSGDMCGFSGNSFLMELWSRYAVNLPKNRNFSSHLKKTKKNIYFNLSFSFALYLHEFVKRRKTKQYIF